MSDETPPPPFVKYTRTVEQTKVVAEVTTENIWQIAAAAKASVDYSGDEPALVVIVEAGRPWRVPVGREVQLLGERIVNAAGFNRDGDWQPVEP